MTRAAYIYSTPTSARYALVRGRVGGWFKAQGIPALRTAMHGGYWLRSERVNEVMARLELDGFLVRYVDGTAPPYVPPALNGEEVA